jgi:hypothetical protein
MGGDMDRSEDVWIILALKVAEVRVGRSYLFFLIKGRSYLICISLIIVINHIYRLLMI